uniref:Minor capsid protein P11 C-terminal conserved region domain-containing protein n=1 Tax=viral metagenome TaxID=1070528 RepID=A0A6C0KN53_9ZZZZ
MSASLKKLWNNYGIGGVLISIIVLYGLYMLYKNLMSKGSVGGEMMSQNRPSAYNNSSNTSGPQPALESGNEVYSSVSGSSQPSGMGIPPSCSKASTQNPSDLLPKDTNSQWAQLNPAGKGDLANINLLKAGYHIGIDTIGQTLRNANLQIRSEPPNPQVNVGPWNLSTIEPDFMRPPLELGQGTQ